MLPDDELLFNMDMNNDFNDNSKSTHAQNIKIDLILLWRKYVPDSLSHQLIQRINESQTRMYEWIQKHVKLHPYEYRVRCRHHKSVQCEALAKAQKHIALDSMTT